MNYLGFREIWSFFCELLKFDQDFFVQKQVSHTNNPLKSTESNFPTFSCSQRGQIICISWSPIEISFKSKFISNHNNKQIRKMLNQKLEFLKFQSSIEQILYQNPFEPVIFSNQGNGVSTKIHKLQKKGIKTSKQWTVQENQIFLSFMLAHPTEFSSDSTKKKTKIYKRLSEYLAESCFKKTPEQCRGHFKKLKERLGSFQKIVEEVKRKIERTKRVDDQKRNLQLTHYEFLQILESRECFDSLMLSSFLP